VYLPPLQRGFVWDPVRIINLWDSLLRGFPVGSLLLSEIGGMDCSENLPNQYWLLDGQQRATTVAMGFYNPWGTHAHLAEDDKNQGWTLRVMPVLWIDLGAVKSDDDEKFFSPYVVTQSHPWGYNQFGRVLSEGKRREALNAFLPTTGPCPYTSFKLKDVFPMHARIPVPMAFVIESTRKCLGNDGDQMKGSLVSQCQHLPEVWQSRFKGQLGDLPATEFTRFCEAGRSLIKDYVVHLNYLNFRTKDSVTCDDNSVLFVRLNTGGKPLNGEELIFSLYKSAFPKAKEAVENAAAGFMPPSHLFSLLVRLVAADGDPSKLHHPVSLRDFKAKISDSVFKERLEGFINDRVHNIVATARDLLTGNHSYHLPMALATRTIKEAPDIFLALLFWLDRGGSVTFGSEKHQYLLAVITALSWFGGNARQKLKNLQQWMQEVSRGCLVEDFWKPDTIRILFTRLDNPVPSFPAPDALEDFLEEAIVKNANYNWETLGNSCPKHPIFSGYSHIPKPDEVPSKVESVKPPDLLRERLLQENLRSFIGTLCWSTKLLLFAQRDFLDREFQWFQQWDLVLEDTNSPWDWDHIYPSACGLHNVYPKYREWHDTIGNKRAEELSHNRGNGSCRPKDKLADLETRRESVISEEVWEMIQGVDENIKDPITANTVCRIILRRMAGIYGKWYTTLGIGLLLASRQE
jgi:hypothetical protein